MADTTGTTATDTTAAETTTASTDTAASTTTDTTTSDASTTASTSDSTASTDTTSTTASDSTGSSSTASTDASTDASSTATTTESTNQKIYDALVALCGKNLGLFYKDETSGMGDLIRTFSYTSGSVDDDTWAMDYALNCGGIAFTIKSDGTMIDVISRPMTKFFEYLGFADTQDLDLDGITVTATVKEDGMLVSSYMSGGYLYLKTKSSIYSPIAVLAMQTINKPEYNDLRNKVTALENSGYTVNMEYVSPKSRNILYYSEARLIVINAINRETGEHLSFDTLFADSTLRKYMTSGSKITNVEDWMDEAVLQENMEGYVCETTDGVLFKVKTNWYKALLSTRNALSDDKTLFRAISIGAYSDVVNIFEGYDYAIDKARAFQDVFLTVLEGATNTFISAMKTLNGKEYRDYVISARKLLKSTDYQWLHSLIVSNFNQPIDYNSIAVSISTLIVENYAQYVPSGYTDPIVTVPRSDI